MKNFRYIAFVLIALLSSCTQRTIYNHAETLPIEGWEADSAFTFSVDIQDSAIAYDLLLCVRHSDTYPFQNMWLGINEDTIEFFLANQYGKWLGNGKGRLIEMPVLYEQNYRFPHCGIYEFKIRQLMREDCLKGVNDVIFKVEKHE